MLFFKILFPFIFSFIFFVCHLCECTCIAIGQIPDSSRFLVGQYVTVHDDVISHVNITNVKEEDGGEYMCTAQNIIGKYVVWLNLNEISKNPCGIFTRHCHSFCVCMRVCKFVCDAIVMRTDYLDSIGKSTMQKLHLLNFLRHCNAHTHSNIHKLS